MRATLRSICEVYPLFEPFIEGRDRFLKGMVIKMMNCIIEWCNENQGFMTAVMSICSLIVSITAVVISVVLASIPYRKKVAIWSFNDCDFDDNDDVKTYKVNVFITKIGNKRIKIRAVSVYWDGKLLGQNIIEKEDRRNLPPTEEIPIIVEFPYENYDFGIKDKFKIVAVDVEGRKYFVKSGCVLG